MIIEINFCGYAYHEDCLYIWLPKIEYSKCVKVFGNERFVINHSGMYPNGSYKLCDKNSWSIMITLKFELEKEKDLHAHSFNIDTIHSKLIHNDLN